MNGRLFLFPSNLSTCISQDAATVLPSKTIQLLDIKGGQKKLAVEPNYICSKSLTPVYILLNDITPKAKR